MSETGGESMHNWSGKRVCLVLATALGLAAVGPFGPNPARGQDAGAEASSAPEAEAGADAPEEMPLLKRSEAIETTLEENHDLEIAAREVAVARRNVSIGNAGFLPSLNAIANQNHSFGGEGLFGQGQIFSQTQLGVELSWVIFSGLRRFSTLDRLKALRSISELQRRAEVESTLADVVKAYYDVVRQRKLLRAYEETREVSKQRLAIARSRWKAGTGSKVDVNLARVELNRDRSAVASQRIALTRSKTELNRLMGREADREFRVDQKVQVATGMDYEKTRERALEENPRLEAIRRRRVVVEERIDEARAQRWPRVQLTLGYNYSEFHRGLAPPFNTPFALEYGLSFSIPIFRGFNIGRRIKNTRSERAIRDTVLRREEIRLQKAVRDTHEAYRRHLQRIEFARKSVEVAEENVDAALAELEAGTVTQVEVRQVQLNLQNARTRLIEAKFRAKRAELELRRLSGRLYDAYVE